MEHCRAEHAGRLCSSTAAAPSSTCTDTGAVGYQFHWDPDHYIELMRAEVPDYDRLQETTADVTRPIASRSILESMLVR